MSSSQCLLVTLGMFIIDEFEFLDNEGKPTGKVLEAQIGGGGTYCMVGARIWADPARLGMIIDRGKLFPPEFQRILESYGPIWLYRDDLSRETTRALNLYRGETRGFKYLVPRVRISPKDLVGTRLACPKMLHFVCSPTRAKEILAELKELNWDPLLIFEPIPDRCVPEELPSLKEVMTSLHVLSPNAEEALTLLSMPLPPTRKLVEEVAERLFYVCGQAVHPRAVVLRAAELGAYVYCPEYKGKWVPPCFRDGAPVVDVTGAGNAFLGGLAAGLELGGGDILEATYFASVSAGFTIEQVSLPPPRESWTDVARRRLERLKSAVAQQR